MRFIEFQTEQEKTYVGLSTSPDDRTRSQRGQHRTFHNLAKVATHTLELWLGEHVPATDPGMPHTAPMSWGQGKGPRASIRGATASLALNTFTLEHPRELQTDHRL